MMKRVFPFRSKKILVPIVFATAARTIVIERLCAKIPSLWRIFDPSRSPTDKALQIEWLVSNRSVDLVL